MYVFPHELQPERERIYAPLGVHDVAVELNGLRTVLTQYRLAEVAIEYGHVSSPLFAEDMSSLEGPEDYNITARLWYEVFQRRLKYDWWLDLARKGYKELAMELSHQPYETVDVLSEGEADSSVTFFNFSHDQLSDIEILNLKNIAAQYLAYPRYCQAAVIFTHAIPYMEYVELARHGIVIVERSTTDDIDYLAQVLGINQCAERPKVRCEYSEYSGLWLVRGIQSVQATLSVAC